MSFAIGGVAGDDEVVDSQNGCMVKAVITYKLPYQVHGARASMMIGLPNNLAATTIMGYPFQEKAKFTIITHKAMVHSEVFGQAYKIQMKAPAALEKPIAQVPGSGGLVLLASIPSEEVGEAYSQLNQEQTTQTQVNLVRTTPQGPLNL